MLVEKIKNRVLSDVLLPAEEFRPFPKIGDREGWSVVTEETAKLWVELAEEFFDFEWPVLTASKFLHFHRTGENIPYLFDFFKRRSLLGSFAVAECIENEGRFLDQIVTGIYCICEETSWMTPYDLFSATKNTLPAEEDVIVDLACSETAALLAYVCYLLEEKLDAINPRICQRMKKEIYRRTIRPYLDRNDYWWMGFKPNERINNWNPWCNKNMISCFLLTAPDEETRNAGIEKALRSLDRYIEEYPQDGCCDEGPGYWAPAGGALNSCLELLHNASEGAIDIFDVKIVQDIGRYICSAYIHDDYFVNYADGDARVGSGSAAYSYGKNIGDANMVALGAGGKCGRPNLLHWFGLYGYLENILTEKDRLAYDAPRPYLRDSWMSVCHTMTAREKEGSCEGLFLAAKAGYNAESHNHNDVGNFIVYADGKPLIVDVGTEEYTAKTFGPERYSIWYIGSLYHNCPSVNGVPQHAGKEYAACDVSYRRDERSAGIAMDIAGAYPKEAGVRSWVRDVAMDRSDAAVITISDCFALEAPGAVQYHFVTAVQPVLVSDGLIEMAYDAGKKVCFTFNSECQTAEIETIALSESRLVRNWGNALYRINLIEKNPVQAAERSVRIARG